ncbi:MAG: DUF4013 domain-containing protein [Natronomonas sp.]
MFREALSYPTRPPEGGRSVIVGGFLLVVITACLGIAGLDAPYAYLAVAAIIPWLLVRGYYVRVIRTTIAEKRPTPARFDDIRQLSFDGVRAVGIAGVYLLPAAAVLGPLVAVRALGSDLSDLLGTRLPETAIVVLIAAVGFLAVIALMYLLGALYVLPVAVARFAHSGRWQSAFEFRRVIDGAVTEDYAIAWGVSLIIQVTLLPFAYLLRFVLIGFFLHFIVAMGVRYCYGQGVGAALGLSPVATEERDDTSEPDKGPDLKPAFVRVDTAQWGVTRTSDGPDPTPENTPIEESEREATATAPDDTNEHTESEAAGWDLRPAVRRVSDEESTEERQS